MALYALGDLHLSFQADKRMDKFGAVWKRHEQKIEKYVKKTVGPEDTLVLPATIPGGRSFPSARRIWPLSRPFPGERSC